MSISNAYEILCPIGKGAYSCVYKARLRSTGKEFAIKTVEKRYSKRIKNEISIHSSLNHPSVLKLHTYFEDSTHFYLVLELCEMDLFSHIRSEGTLSESETRLLMGELADGLSYLHTNKILHRDLKLGNLLLSDGHIKIADFGLAVRLTTFEEETHTLCGTPTYISPEVIQRRPYGLASDLWSLGCIIYACLVGHPPFEGKTLQETVLSFKDGVSLPESLSAESKNLISSLLVWESNERMTIEEVRNHSFFGNCSINLFPFSTSGLDPIKHKTRNGELEITEDGWVKVAVGNRRLEISGDGLSVIYKGKLIGLYQLKNSASKLYEYAKNFVEVVRGKTPKVILEEKDVTFMLMMNTPFPNFETHFNDGARVTYQIGSEAFHIHPLVGPTIVVNPYSDLENIDPRNCKLIEISMQGLQKVMNQERATFNKNV